MVPSRCSSLCASEVLSTYEISEARWLIIIRFYVMNRWDGELLALCGGAVIVNTLTSGKLTPLYLSFIQ